MNTVVIVENDSKMIMNYKRMLEPYQDQIDITYFRYPEEVIEHIRKKAPAVLVCELDLPVMSGKEVFDMVEMMSPTTVKIAMSQVTDVSKTLDIMNQSRIFKLIIKPFFLVEDLVGPIQAALKYHELQEKEEISQRNAAIELEMLNKRSEELSRRLEEKKRGYYNSYRAVEAIIRTNLRYGRLDLSKEELRVMNGIFEGVFQEFMRYYMFEARNYVFHANYLKNLFHHPEEGRTFFIYNKAEGEIPNEIMQQMGYVVFLAVYLSAKIVGAYQIKAVLEERERYYVVNLISQFQEAEKHSVSSKKVKMVVARMAKEIVNALSGHFETGDSKDQTIRRIYFRKEEGKA